MGMSTSKGLMKYMSGESEDQQRMIDQGVNPHIRDYDGSIRILLPLAPQQHHALEIGALHHKEDFKRRRRQSMALLKRDLPGQFHRRHWAGWRGQRVGRRVERR